MLWRSNFPNVPIATVRTRLSEQMRIFRKLRAFVGAVPRALLYFRDHKEQVFQAPATDDAPDSMREACRG